MPKEVFTDKDIEELHHRGIQSLRVTDNVVLTDLAYEKAKRLGIRLLFDHADNPPAAPVRPYLLEREPRHASGKSAVSAVSQMGFQPKPAQASTSDIEKRIRSAVIARLGDQVDTRLLDSIIHRVVKATGLK